MKVNLTPGGHAASKPTPLSETLNTTALLANFSSRTTVFAWLYCTIFWSASCATRNKRSEEHTSELQSLTNLVCRLLLEKKKKKQKKNIAKNQNKLSSNIGH